MKRQALALALLFVSSAAWADLPVKCNSSGTMLEMSACAVEEFNAADADLNEVYQKLLAAGSKEPTFIAKLRTAQKAWIRFRDAAVESKFACESEDHRRCWGSMITLEWPAYKTQLTRERTAELAKLLAERFPPKPEQ